MFYFDQCQNNVVISFCCFGTNEMGRSKWSQLQACSAGVQLGLSKHISVGFHYCHLPVLQTKLLHAFDKSATCTFVTTLQAARRLLYTYIFLIISVSLLYHDDVDNKVVTNFVHTANVDIKLSACNLTLHSNVS